MSHMTLELKKIKPTDRSGLGIAFFLGDITIEMGSMDIVYMALLSGFATHGVVC